MRAIVCGGRDYADRARVYTVLDEHAPAIIAHGGAKGADYLAACWAHERGVPHEAFPAWWKSEGKAAGPRRNQRMLEEFAPDVVIAFPGGRGTGDMMWRARMAGVPVIQIDTTTTPEADHAR